MHIFMHFVATFIMILVPECVKLVMSFVLVLAMERYEQLEKSLRIVDCYYVPY